MKLKSKMQKEKKGWYRACKGKKAACIIIIKDLNALLDLLEDYCQPTSLCTLIIQTSISIESAPFRGFSSK